MNLTRTEQTIYDALRSADGARVDPGQLMQLLGAAHPAAQDAGVIRTHVCNLRRKLPAVESWRIKSDRPGYSYLHPAGKPKVELPPITPLPKRKRGHATATIEDRTWAIVAIVRRLELGATITTRQLAADYLVTQRTAQRWMVEIERYLDVQRVPEPFSNTILWRLEPRHKGGESMDVDTRGGAI